MGIVRKPLSCKLRIHLSKFIDNAWFARAQRCSSCNTWLDKRQGELVEHERSLWDQHLDPEEIRDLLEQKAAELGTLLDNRTLPQFDYRN